MRESSQRVLPVSVSAFYTQNATYYATAHTSLVDPSVDIPKIIDVHVVTPEDKGGSKLASYLKMATFGVSTYSPLRSAVRVLSF
jgi:hypothetical protein